jgi:hypothetical protein
MADEAQRPVRLEQVLDRVSPYPGRRPLLETKSQSFKGREAQNETARDPLEESLSESGGPSDVR